MRQNFQKTLKETEQAPFINMSDIGKEKYTKVILNKYPESRIIMFYWDATKQTYTELYSIPATKEEEQLIEAATKRITQL